MGEFTLSSTRWAVGLIVLFLGGCTLSDKYNFDPIYSARTNGGTDTRKVSVSIITDRATGNEQQLRFDNHWSETISCASSEVTVPSPLASGDTKISASPPVAALCSTAQSDAKSGTSDQYPFDLFARSIKAAEPSDACNSVLVYAHGYNNSFRSALLRAGQIAHDAEWPCAMAVFSWGSEAQVDRYAADIERSGYAVPVMMDVLKSLATAKLKTNILAHSMGSRLVLSALAGLSGFCVQNGEIVNQLIAAAPDVSSEDGNDDFDILLKRASPCIHHATIYASGADMVLMVSESVHGGIPRAGLDPAHALNTYAAQNPKVDVVDATDAPGEFFGHGYFVDSYEMQDDIMMALGGVDISRRASDPAAATLDCANSDNTPCKDSHDRYKLKVAEERRPGGLTRFMRHVIAFALAIKYGLPGQ